MKRWDGAILWLFAMTVIMFLSVCYKQQRDLTIFRIEAINRGLAEWVLKNGEMEFHWIK